MAFTRRELISRIAAVGGYSAAVSALGALGLTPQAVASTFNPLQLGSSGKGKHVVIVGAGIFEVIVGALVLLAPKDNEVVQVSREDGSSSSSLVDGSEVAR